MSEQSHVPCQDVEDLRQVLHHEVEELKAANVSPFKSWWFKVTSTIAATLFAATVTGMWVSLQQLKVNQAVQSAQYQHIVEKLNTMNVVLEKVSTALPLVWMKVEHDKYADSVNARFNSVETRVDNSEERITRLENQMFERSQ